MIHQTIRGRIRYTSRKPELAGKTRGQEIFSFTKHSDGRRTLTAHCELNEPDPIVVRDVVYSVDASNRPVDAFVRLTVGGVFMGSGLYMFEGDNIYCESYGPDIGRLSQCIDTNGNYAWFGTHPLSADGYNTCNIDRSKGPATHRIRSFLSSLDHRGASPPMVYGHHIMVEYVGRETITVEAGTFDTHHYRYVGEKSDPLAHPPYNAWVTADDDHIFVRGQVDGYMMTYYELVELERWTGDVS